MRRNRIKLIFQTALIAASILLSGCMDIEYRVKINSDGKEHLSIRVGIPLSASLYAIVLQKEMENDGCAVTAETKGDLYYLICTPSPAPAAGQWQLPYPKDLARDVSFQPMYMNLLVVKVFGMNASFTLDRKKFEDRMSNIPGGVDFPDSAFKVPFKYVISVPGYISSTNADQVEGNRMIWNHTMAPDETVKIHFMSYELNYFWIGVIIFMIALAAIWLAVSRNKTTNPPSGTANTVLGRAPAGSKSDTDAMHANIGIKHLIALPGRAVVLLAGTRLWPGEIQGLEPNTAGAPVAEVRENPDNPQVLGLKNLSTRVWNATLSNGSGVKVDVNQSVKIAKGTRINFGAVIGEIQ